MMMKMKVMMKKVKCYKGWSPTPTGGALLVVPKSSTQTELLREDAALCPGAAGMSGSSFCSWGRWASCLQQVCNVEGSVQSAKAVVGGDQQTVQQQRC